MTKCEPTKHHFAEHQEGSVCECGEMVIEYVIRDWVQVCEINKSRFMSRAWQKARS